MKHLLLSFILVLGLSTAFAQAGQRERVKEIQQSVKDGGFWFLFKWVFWGGCKNCYGYQQAQPFLKEEEKTYWM